jgi:uncharacterized protein (DUF934 family)
MPLVKDGARADCSYRPLADDAALPADGAILVSAARLLAEGASWQGRTALVGVIWPNDRDVAELVPFLDQLALIVLQFPKFRDGRAYTQARLLRERFGYRGELRAAGQVLRDQLLFMQRAGFNSFDLAKPADADAVAEAIARYSVFYQPTGDGRITVFRARRGESHPGRAVQERSGT